MGKLIQFLINQRFTIVFILFETLIVWILTNNNPRYHLVFLNSSNWLSGNISHISGTVTAYFQLKDINAQLAEENRMLQQKLLNASVHLSATDTMGEYLVTTAKVIGNSFRNTQNFLLLKVGGQDGIIPGMAVIANEGVVGQIQSVSKQFASTYSLLNPNMLVSSKIKDSNTLCTTQWEPGDPTVAKVRFVPRHIKLTVGDTVVTSGFNSIFPENINIGTIKEVQLENHMTFYHATVSLATDFTSLSYVYVIKDKLKPVRDSVQIIF